MEVRSAGTMELEQLRDVVNHELRRRDGREANTAENAAYDKATDRAFGAAIADPSEFRSTTPRGVPVDSAGPRGLTVDNVEDAFRYHAWHAGQVDRGNQVRDALVGAAKTALRNVPPGPDRDAGLRKLREARMDFNSAITHNGRF